MVLIALVMRLSAPADRNNLVTILLSLMYNKSFRNFLNTRSQCIIFSSILIEARLNPTGENEKVVAFRACSILRQKVSQKEEDDVEIHYSKSHKLRVSIYAVSITAPHRGIAVFALLHVAKAH